MPTWGIRSRDAFLIRLVERDAADIEGAFLAPVEPFAEHRVVRGFGAGGVEGGEALLKQPVEGCESVGSETVSAGRLGYQTLHFSPFGGAPEGFPRRDSLSLHL